MGASSPDYIPSFEPKWPRICQARRLKKLKFSFNLLFMASQLFFPLLAKDPERNMLPFNFAMIQKPVCSFSIPIARYIFQAAIP